MRDDSRQAYTAELLRQFLRWRGVSFSEKDEHGLITLVCRRGEQFVVHPNGRLTSEGTSSKLAREALKSALTDRPTRAVPVLRHPTTNPVTMAELSRFLLAELAILVVATLGVSFGVVREGPGALRLGLGGGAVLFLLAIVLVFQAISLMISNVVPKARSCLLTAALFALTVVDFVLMMYALLHDLVIAG